MKVTVLFDSALFPLSVCRCTLEKDETLVRKAVSSASAVLVESGDVSFVFPDNIVPVLSHSGIFINQNRERKMRANRESCFVLLEFTQQLTGHLPLVSDKYIKPLLRLSGDYTVLSKTACSSLSSALDSLEMGQFGCELKMLSAVFDLLFTVCSGKEDLLASPSTASDERLERMLDFMNSRLDSKLSLEEVAEAGFVSQREASRLFEKYLGSSPMKYFLFLRLEKARSLLERKQAAIADICQETGFESVSHFSTCFRKMYAMTPGEYRNRYR